MIWIPAFFRIAHQTIAGVSSADLDIRNGTPREWRHLIEAPCYVTRSAHTLEVTGTSHSRTGVLRVSVVEESTTTVFEKGRLVHAEFETGTSWLLTFFEGGQMVQALYLFYDLNTFACCSRLYATHTTYYVFGTRLYLFVLNKINYRAVGRIWSGAHSQ